MSYKTQKFIITITFLAIPLLLLLVFVYYPAIRLFQISLTNWDGLSKEMKFIGFRNYTEAFQDKKLFMALTNNLAYLVAGLFQTTFGFYFAVVLNTKIKGRNFFRSGIFMPYILNGVAVAFMFNFLYNYQSSPINVVVRYLGFDGIHFLGNEYYANFSLAFIGFWKYTGFAMIIFLGALQSISTDYYEAASIEGATFIQKIRYITLPLVKQSVELLLILTINGSLQAFYEPFIITKGGPAGRTATFVTHTITTAFEFSKFGKASAMGIILMFMIIIVVSIQRRLTRSEE